MKALQFTVAAALMAGAPSIWAQDSAPLDTVMNAQNNKKFTGSPISLNLKDADVHEVLRLIGDASGFNIIVHPSVQGKLTLSLEQVPWDQALDVVMTTLRLGADRSESVLRILPRDLLNQEKQADLDSKRMANQSAPRITRVFPISYADLSGLSSLLQGFAASQVMSAGGGAPASILVDQNTQSLIIRDTAEGMDRLKKMIALLDVQTPQIIIEAKVIEATETFVRSLNGNLGAKTDGIAGSINGAGLAGSAGVAGAVTGSVGGGAFSVGIGASSVLNAVLGFNESESKAKVVSSPKVMILSGKTANIVQGSNLAVQGTTIVGGTPVVTTNFVPYNTSLNVTPRATNDGSVFMKLNLSRDTLQVDGEKSSVSPRSINTEVVVDSGNTLVLGGVQSISSNEASSGFPFFRKIPLIGWLFGKDTNTSDKTELMFFVTPRIVNVKKTSISEGGDAPSKAGSS
jgi:type IV pilus assembly protein PilQ